MTFPRRKRSTRRVFIAMLTHPGSDYFPDLRRSANSYSRTLKDTWMPCEVCSFLSGFCLCNLLIYVSRHGLNTNPSCWNDRRVLFVFRARIRECNGCYCISTCSRGVGHRDQPRTRSSRSLPRSLHSRSYFLGPTLSHHCLRSSGKNERLFPYHQWAYL